ncbi:MAG: hypothetical protein RR561_08650 [Peptostreptococcus sp.]|uniref:hypothetical protein n=1 Tax=Peptostreptococcus sp. TaxID=1262 RepID=UPI002FC72EBB
MFKLNIYDVNKFFETVNECNGNIRIKDSFGVFKNINKEYDLQNDMLEDMDRVSDFQEFTVDVDSPKDYMKLIFHSMYNC